MIRVLHVVERLEAAGGTPRKLMYLAKHADRGTIDHRVLSLLPGDLDADFRALGVQVDVAHSTAPHRVIVALIRQMQTGQVDVVATHFLRSLVCGSVATRLFRVALIHNEHGPALKPSVERIRRSTLGRLMKRNCMQASDAIVCNSAYTAATIRQRYTSVQDRLHVIHNPVESRVSGFAELSAREVSGRITLGHVGGMIPVRDQATLLRAVKHLRDAGIDAVLELIGDGPSRGELELLTGQLGLREYVRFLGYRKDLTDILSRIDVYVNPAIAEGFGIAVVEAMLAGIPVVLADAGAHRELVAGGAVGVLYRPRDAADLCLRIQELLQSPQRYQDFRTSGRAYAARAFAPRKYAMAYEALARKVLAGRERAGDIGRVA